MRNGIVLVILICAGINMAAPAAAYNCAGAPNIADVTSEADTRVLLQTKTADAPGRVHLYDKDWQRQGQVTLTVDNQTRQSVKRPLNFEALARAEGGGWWVLSRNGDRYRYTDQWQYSGRANSLAADSVLDVTRTAGSWWVLTESEVLRYDDQWRQVSAHSHSLDRPMGLSSARGSLWLVTADQGTNGGNIYRVDTAATTETTDLQMSHAGDFDWEVRQPNGVVPAENGKWELVEYDGRITEHTGYWQFTGTESKVTNSRPLGCPTGWAFLLFVVTPVIIIGTIVGFGIFLWLYWGNHADQAQLGFGTIFAWVVVVPFRLNLFPPELTAIYWLPDLLIAAVLFSIPLITVTAVLRDSTAVDVSLGESIVAGVKDAGLYRTVLTAVCTLAVQLHVVIAVIAVL